MYKIKENLFVLRKNDDVLISKELEFYGDENKK